MCVLVTLVNVLSLYIHTASHALLEEDQFFESESSLD